MGERPTVLSHPLFWETHSSLTPTVLNLHSSLSSTVLSQWVFSLIQCSLSPTVLSHPLCLVTQCLENTGGERTLFSRENSSLSTVLSHRCSLTVDVREQFSLIQTSGWERTVDVLSQWTVLSHTVLSPTLGERELFSYPEQWVLENHCSEIELFSEIDSSLSRTVLSRELFS